MSSWVFPFLFIVEVQRAAPLPVGETGVASGKGLRRDPKRNEIDAFGNFVAFWVEAPCSARGQRP
jgi:hypothetical protein